MKKQPEEDCVIDHTWGMPSRSGTWCGRSHWPRTEQEISQPRRLQEKTWTHMNTIFVLRVFWTEKNNESCVHSEKKAKLKNDLTVLVVVESWVCDSQAEYTPIARKLWSQKHHKTMHTSKTAVDVMILVFFNLSHADNQVCSQINLYIFRDFLSLSVGSETFKVRSVAK